MMSSVSQSQAVVVRDAPGGGVLIERGEQSVWVADAELEALARTLGKRGARASRLNQSARVWIVLLAALLISALAAALLILQNFSPL